MIENSWGGHSPLGQLPLHLSEEENPSEICSVFANISFRHPPVNFHLLKHTIKI